ncbi:MAG: hypothetical protein K2X81_00995 [Candidatus Obscuribacterales bacterium]|nr:hypothetical protein [Candidatus Obscuribacterales bacterium]
MKDKNKIPTTTPWGKPNETTVLAPGIVHFDTPSHGGIWLDQEQNAKVPMHVKRRTFLKNGIKGWYEEDEDMGRLRPTFPEIFRTRETGTKTEPINAVLKDSIPLSDKDVESLLNEFSNGIVFKLLS